RPAPDQPRTEPLRRYPTRDTLSAFWALTGSGAREGLTARRTASPISRMGTFYEASAVKLQFRVIGHERQRSDMLLAACLDIRPGRKASDDLLSVPTTRVGHPILCSLCGESRQTREEARPFSVAALSSGPVPLSSGSHQVAPSLRRSSASDRGIPLRRLESGAFRHHAELEEAPQLDQQLPGEGHDP